MRLSRTLVRSLAVCVLSSGLARAQTPPFEKVLSAVTLDFNNDATMDRAVLAQGEDGADLYLYLGDADTAAPAGKMKLALLKKNFVFSGLLWGTLPGLAVNGKGSLVVKAENSAIGRNKWDEALAIGWRGGDFLVLGLTYASRDGLDPRAGGNCDLNLATGKGTRNGKPVTFAPRPVKVADWSDDSLPKDCQF